ncbi:MAG TPA: gamma-glutamyltransferase [Ilumatobacteraceae bacterium]|nr:gamma-glutamyltransferase [Ilumatobacteraceae bacterium]
MTPSLAGSAAAAAVMAEQCTGRGRNGVVCAAAPLAALVGAECLREGGNAFDAAVSAALAETVLLPPKCGLGGDLVAIVRRAGADRPEALIAVGGAPSGLASIATAGAWRDVGPNSVGPPAAAAGYQALAELGALGRERLAAEAIDLARNGFPWAAVCTRLSEQSTALVAEMNPDGCAYFPNGAPIAPGALTKLPGLGDVLAEWVRLGDRMLDGPVGAAIVDAVAARGGALDHASLEFAVAEWSQCTTRTIADRQLWATPAPTHGQLLLDAIDATPSDAGAVYRSLLAAIGRGHESLADPSGTSIVSAGDRFGNVVVIVHSNSYPRFGSGIVVAGYDLVLANRAGRGFSPVPGHPNFPTAGRRPATTLHAWAVSGPDRNGVRLMGGTPGGANQITWNAQSLTRVLDGCDEPGVLVTAPLWEWLPDDGVRIEAGMPDTDAGALRAVAPRVIATSQWGCKSAQQVVRIPDTITDTGGVWVGAADPRTQGAAIGV